MIFTDEKLVLANTSRSRTPTRCHNWMLVCRKWLMHATSVLSLVLSEVSPAPFETRQTGRFPSSSCFKRTKCSVMSTGTAAQGRIQATEMSEICVSLQSVCHDLVQAPTCRKVQVRMEWQSMHSSTHWTIGLQLHGSVRAMGIGHLRRLS